jgi:hypothetical protein
LVLMIEFEFHAGPSLAATAIVERPAWVK